MPWELTIQHPNGHRLGSPKEVQAALSRVWVQLHWEIVPPLLEEIKDQPDHPVHQQIPTWDPETRRRASLPRTVGILEDEAFSFELYGIDDDPVEDFYLDVRGNGDPTPVLMQLKRQAGWSIKELATGRILDERQIRERWDNFRQMRDGATGQAGSEKPC